MNYQVKLLPGDPDKYVIEAQRCKGGAFKVCKDLPTYMNSVVAHNVADALNTTHAKTPEAGHHEPWGAGEDERLTDLNGNTDLSLPTICHILNRDFHAGRNDRKPDAIRRRLKKLNLI